MKSTMKFYAADNTGDTPEQIAYDKEHYGTSASTYTPAPAVTTDQKPKTNAGQAALNFLSNPAYMQSIGTGINTILGAAGQIQNLAHGGGNQPTAPIGGGQGQGGGGGSKPRNPSNTILGMSPTVFYVGVGFVVILAGVGIFMATRGGDSSAPAGK